MKPSPPIKSAGATAATRLSTVATEARPDACYSLTDGAADVWRATVDVLPAGWIGAEALPILAAYCRTTVPLRRLGMLVEQEEHAEAFDPAYYQGLIRSHGAQAQVHRRWRRRCA